MLDGADAFIKFPKCVMVSNVEKVGMRIDTSKCIVSEYWYISCSFILFTHESNGTAD